MQQYLISDSLTRTLRQRIEAAAAAQGLDPHEVNLFPLLEEQCALEPEPDLFQPEDNLLGQSCFVKETEFHRSLRTDMVNEYRIVKELGEGNFGKVFLVEKEGEEYAMKAVNLQRLTNKLRSIRAKDSKESPLDLIAREVAILKKLKHDNIVKLLQVINDSEEGFFYLVTEYFSGGCFLSAKHREMRPFDFIFDQNRYRIKEAIAKKYFQQLCSALDYMHNYAKIVHRDIKPENCLIDDARIAFADFGLSKKAGSSESDNFGTAFYMAPQRFSDKAFDPFPNDIWALGVTLYEAVVGVKPFEASNPIELKSKIELLQPYLPEYLSKPLAQLLTQMLGKSAEVRPTIGQVIQSEWLREGQEKESGADRGLFFITEKELCEAISQLILPE